MDHDHPGRFLDWFAEDDILPVFVRLFEGEPIPTLGPYDVLFVLGGAQDTWQEDQFPYLADEKSAIRDWVLNKAKPYLGVCLGHQLLATALGGDVGPAATPEVGVFDVSLTDSGKAHAFMRQLPPSQPALQWHHAEVKSVPAGAEVLARSPLAAVQALAVGNHALSTQFHCEFSPQTVAGWSSQPSYVATLERLKGAGAYEALREQAWPLMPQMMRNTRLMYENFRKASGLK